MSKPLLILLFVELLLAAALGRMGHLDQPAALEWQRHPTVETREAFDREKQIEESGRWLFSGVVFTVLAGATFFLYWEFNGDPFALILKRFGTSLVLFTILFPVLYVGSMTVGFTAARIRAENSHLQSGQKKEAVGAGFGRTYGAVCFIGAVGISALASAVVAFSGILPWCRRRTQPPQLPARMAENGIGELAVAPIGCPATPVGNSGAAQGPPPVIESGVKPGTNWMGRHFRRHLERKPWAFCWRVGVESTVMSLVASTLLAVVFGAPKRMLLDLTMPGAFSLLIVVAPPVETLIFQAFPIFIVRSLKGSIGLQILISTFLFSAAHFPEGIVTGVAAGVIGGLYFAFAYSHWRTKSRWQAFWITASCHAVHNGIIFILLVALGYWR